MINIYQSTMYKNVFMEKMETTHHAYETTVLSEDLEEMGKSDRSRKPDKKQSHTSNVNIMHIGSQSQLII